jgi:hypothetical protein
MLSFSHILAKPYTALFTTHLLSAHHNVLTLVGFVAQN